MKNKVIFIFILFFNLQFVSSCFNFCKDVAHFDFTAMESYSSSDTLSENDTLFLNLYPSDVTFMAQHSGIQEFGFSSALAFSCAEGNEGLKFPIEKIEITSDSDFDDTHLAGDDLTDLFRLQSNRNPPNQFVSIAEQLPLQLLYFSSIETVLLSHPTLDKTHVFTFHLTKSNGETVLVECEAIQWV